MTITLSPELEARLLGLAERRRSSPSQTTEELLSRAIDAEEADDALTEEDITAIRAGIARGLADGETGRVAPLAEWADRKRQRWGAAEAARAAVETVGMACP